MTPHPSQSVILASTSPRRARLLREAGIAFETAAPPFDDGLIDLADTPVELAVRALAYMKAASVADGRDAGRVIGSDTLVSLEGKAMGKPADEAAAREMLGSLVGRTHDVVTGVAVIDAATGACEVFSDTTRVGIVGFGDAGLDAYLASGEWRGKAGGYNLAELEDRWRFEIDGDPTTVVGLPMRRLSDLLG